MSIPWIATGVGAVVGAAFWAFSETDAILAVPIWLIPVLVPGLIPLWPLMLALGGAHGEWSEGVLALTPLTNGFAYLWIARRVRRWRN